MFRWEYIDVLITANSKLCQHMDHVDDDTDGHDYSLDGVDYKVSNIMTTRDRLARAMDKIRLKLEKEGADKYKLLGGPYINEDDIDNFNNVIVINIYNRYVKLAAEKKSYTIPPKDFVHYMYTKLTQQHSNRK